jgi:hypothetical protein
MLPNSHFLFWHWFYKNSRFLVCSVCCICLTRLRLIDWCTNWNERPTGVIVASSCSLSIINKHNFTSLGLLPFTLTSNLFPTSYSSSNFQSIVFPVVACELASFYTRHTTPPKITTMDQRELDSRIKSLQKAINEKEPAETIIAMMETLKNNVNPTEELLRVCS